MIGDDVAEALPELREQAESLMRATITIVRVTGTTTDADGYEQPTTTPVYQGKARVVRSSQIATSADVAGRPTTIQRPQINLPVGAYQMQVGDVANVDTNPDDPSLAGRRYRISGEAPAGSVSVQYRVAAEEVL